MPTPRKIHTVISKIVSYSETVKLFRLKSGQRIPRFKPGQFLHLALDKYDPSYNWPESRVFSIANSPSRIEFIDVFVSQKGKFTGKMFDILKVGAEVWIKLPYGIFNFEDSVDRNTILIAGGTGITPFISFLQYTIDKMLTTKIHLYYGIREKKVLIINNLVEECKRKLNNFKFHLFIENTENVGIDFEYTKGILPVNKIIKNCKIHSNPIFYLSGPPILITNFNNELINQGYDSGNIRYDSWE